MYIIYKTTNLINSKFYIGVHCENSKKSHAIYLGSGKALAAAVKKYGRQNFIRETLHYFESLEDALNKEKEIVNEDFIKDKNNYNLNVGGKAPPNSKLWWTDEHSLNTSNRLKDNKFRLGKKDSEETKLKKSMSMRESLIQGRWERTEKHKLEQAERARLQLLEKNPMCNISSRNKVSESKIGRRKMVDLEGNFKYVKPSEFSKYLNLNYIFKYPI